MMKASRPAWIFNRTRIADPKGHGEQAVTFLKSLKHPKSKLEGKPFDLPPFWERIVRRIYGPVDTAGNRIVKTVFVMMPRGGRKTTIGAGLGLLHTFGYQRTVGGLALAAAAAEDQAVIAYDECAGIVKATPWLKKAAKLKESLFTLGHPKSGSELRAIPADGDVQLGKTPTFVLADELIAWKDRKLWKALRTGLVKTPGSLMVIITQAGRGQNNLAYELFDYAKRIQSGAIEDPGFLPILFETDAKADWRDEKVWHFVNPGLALGFPDLAGLRQLARESEQRPAERDDFRQFNLNTWLDYSTSPFVDMDVYDEGATPVDLEALAGEPCWIAVDMGLTTDLTAVVAAWRDGDDAYQVAAWFFCPADNLQGRADRDKVPYPRWRDEGHIIATPGNVTDYRAVEAHIRELCERFAVQEIAFDPAYAQAVMAPLTEDGFPTTTMRQGWVTMAPAIKELERAIIGRKFRHGGNPVLRWMFSNIAVEIDKAGNKTFHKGKSRDRIDGAVAAAMAVARASQGESQRSIYDTPERAGGFLYV
jgi:phage terminase large subunit-like protein